MAPLPIAGEAFWPKSRRRSAVGGILAEQRLYLPLRLPRRFRLLRLVDLGRRTIAAAKRNKQAEANDC